MSLDRSVLAFAGVMLTASGALYRNQGSYLEVVENARLSYRDEPDPEIREWAGKPPGRSHHTVSFTPDGVRTHAGPDGFADTRCSYARPFVDVGPKL